MYIEEELLSLSGIQHYYFCKRQWALIHIEQQWAENKATMEGNYLHENADNPYLVETRNDMFISRAIPLVSYELGFYGIADVVEFKKHSKGIRIDGREGFFKPTIVEYKRGKPKEDARDIVQLVAEVLCMEEMLGCTMTTAYFFYNEIKRRVKITITDDLREAVIKLSNEMHKIYKEKVTPIAEGGRRCKACSLVEICLPRLTYKKVSVSNYIDKYSKEGEDIS